MLDIPPCGEPNDHILDTPARSNQRLERLCRHTPHADPAPQGAGGVEVSRRSEADDHIPHATSASFLGICACSLAPGMCACSLALGICVCSQPGLGHLCVQPGSGHLCAQPGSGHLCAQPGSGHLCVQPGSGHLCVKSEALLARTSGSNGYVGTRLTGILHHREQEE